MLIPSWLSSVLSIFLVVTYSSGLSSLREQLVFLIPTPPYCRELSLKRDWPDWAELSLNSSFGLWPGKTREMHRDQVSLVLSWLPA